MLAPEEIIAKGRSYLKVVLPDFAALDPRVDEMTLTPDSSRWRIVFFAHTGDNPTAATVADLLSRKRIEKEVLLSADDGTLVAVKNTVPF